MRLKAYCMKWHLSKSDAFRDLLVDPLHGKVEVELVDREKWESAAADEPQIFCQVRPPRELREDCTAKIVWIPMWDSVQGSGLDQSWWNDLPKHIRIVSFAKAISKRARQAGLKTLHLTYYKDPSSFRPTEWDNLTVFYWNRTGLVGPDFLGRFCRAVDAKKLIFRPDLDPRGKQNFEKYFELPDHLGPTSVEVIHEMDRLQHLAMTEQANIYLAPRAAEGVGMTFIEAMCRGSAVVAYDAPTMNEYIKHQYNGYLINNEYSKRLPVRIHRRFRRACSDARNFVVSDYQPWSEITRLDWQRLGSNALQRCEEGYRKWQQAIDEYSRFVTEW